MNTSTIVQKLGNYCNVLGYDGPGTIVLPRRGAIDITEVLRWPSCEQEH